jgi:hypothetical protein
MSKEAIELVQILLVAGPAWAVAGILAYRSPQLLKELFAGIRSLLMLKHSKDTKPKEKKVN